MTHLRFICFITGWICVFERISWMIQRQIIFNSPFSPPTGLIMLRPNIRGRKGYWITLNGNNMFCIEMTRHALKRVYIMFPFKWSLPLELQTLQANDALACQKGRSRPLYTVCRLRAPFIRSFSFNNEDHLFANSGRSWEEVAKEKEAPALLAAVKDAQAARIPCGHPTHEEQAREQIS